MTRSIITSVNAGVATLTLSQPEIRNAFSDVVIAEITAAFAEVGQRDDVRAVVLAAEGPAFCAGANLNWMRAMADYTREENLADAGKLAAMLHTIATCPHPTIARVQGDVYAGGMGLVAACDMAVAVDAAHFCLSEVKIGLIPATIAPYVLRAMGTRAGQRYFLTGERFDAAEALRIGFVHQVVAADDLDSAVDGLLKHLLSAGPAAVRACKRLVDDVAGCEINAALVARTVECIADIRASAEGKEGVQAFLNKRKPNWLG
ncbi:enoyl-CoA hydratase/isomerase family protein [Comamonas denitrificans]|uniref:Enoyl-CoA hydratase/isomerase family protein n=1 Tax=Comamonas denitrificans TaxID=117506 RepID=A0A939GYA6_9BURK|nr:enoyl-CoA hydratase/isomerase family protein [Comamonas denitrificans]MBO1248543.1 enoyl-CoA hydratase/isomerase family protein [Comamonas denitrificans]